MDSLLAVWSPELTRESLFDALQQRHVYASTGGRILLYFTADKHLMGEEYQTSSAPEFKVVVVGDGPLKKVELFKYDASSGYGSIHKYSSFGTEFPNDRYCNFSVRDTGFNQDSFYYVRVVGKDEKRGTNAFDGSTSRAWSSPIWINKQ